MGTSLFYLTNKKITEFYKKFKLKNKYKQLK